MGGNFTKEEQFGQGTVNLFESTIDPSTEAKQDTIISKLSGLSGASTAGTVALTLADTWYAIPGTIPASDYCLAISAENNSGVLRWSFSNTGTPSETNGNKMWNETIILELGANQCIYIGSTVAGDDINWTVKLI